ncbi:MAG: isoprenylcysteine carboxylmethyltransferase family protein [Rhodospirillales bacterium]|nr:isoprenylcysteine carboxylmethyltransferase family protein [Rhodospirillales bacterium]
MLGEEFTRWFLAAFFTGVAGFYTLSILIKKRKRGVSPVTPGAAGSEHFWNHRSFVVCRAAIWLACVARVPFPSIDRWLVPIPFLWAGKVMMFGVFLLAASFVSIVLIHIFMRQEWHSGIDPERPRRLITTGPFALSRNPTFVCIQLAQVGFFSRCRRCLR